MEKPKIIFEDQDILVLDKPSGLTVNRSETAKEGTLQDFLDKRFENPNDGSEFSKRSGIVHRLDKETSGIMVVAKTSDAFENLKNQFKQRETNKTYIALVHGKLKSGEGEINAPLGRLPWNRLRFGVLAGGREAKTFYRAVKILSINNEPLTLLEAQPQTGRTHQIRVHLKHIGHPIFADPLYGGRKVSREDRKILQRVFLHAKNLEFNHPGTGERIKLEAELPQELQQIINRYLN